MSLATLDKLIKETRRILDDRDGVDTENETDFLVKTEDIVDSLNAAQRVFCMESDHIRDWLHVHVKKGSDTIVLPDCVLAVLETKYTDDGASISVANVTKERIRGNAPNVSVARSTTSDDFTHQHFDGVYRTATLNAPAKETISAKLLVWRLPAKDFKNDEAHTLQRVEIPEEFGEALPYYAAHNVLQSTDVDVVDDKQADRMLQRFFRQVAIARNLLTSFQAPQVGFEPGRNGFTWSI